MELFMKYHNIKSKTIKSGDLGGHGTGPLRPIKLSESYSTEKVHRTLFNRIS
jgi:hypothetical protein